MPKRVSQHQVEDISRFKYGLALPKEWVSRDKDKDYGIDVEVEIFDADGNPTGLVYWVQLKATDSAKPHDIKNLRFNLEKLAYYRQLELPVLIAKYSTVQDCFYCKWAHEIDPYAAKKGAKSLQVKFDDDDRWDPQKTPIFIQEKLERIKAVKRGGLSLPVPCALVALDNHICGMGSGELLSNLRQEIRDQFSDQIKIQLSREAAPMIVEVSKNTLHVTIEGVYHCTFHAVATMDPKTLIPELTKDIILGLAGAIAQIGYHDLAARIFFIDGIREKLAHKPDLLFFVLPQLLKSYEFEKALDVVNLAIELDDSNFVEMTTHAAILHHLDRKNSKHAIAIRIFLEQCVQRNKKYGPEFYGQALYNLGNFYRSINENRKGISCYLKARKHQPAYTKRAYYYSELAGLLFDLGKYRLASNFYKKSLEIEEADWVRPLYADSLMFAGDYRLAYDEFSGYLADSKKDHFEWRLKYISLEGLLKDPGIESQVRQKKKALDLANVSECTNGDERAKQIEQALSLDLLCSAAWFNFGVEQNHNGQNSEATFAFTMSGLINRYDPESWANATGCAFNSKEIPYPIVLMIINVGYMYGREEYVGRLYDLFSQSGKDMAPLTNALEMIIGQTATIPDQKIVRIPDPDNEGEMINIEDFAKRHSQ